MGVQVEELGSAVTPPAATLWRFLLLPNPHLPVWRVKGPILQARDRVLMSASSQKTDRCLNHAGKEPQADIIL